MRCARRLSWRSIIASSSLVLAGRDGPGAPWPSWRPGPVSLLPRPWHGSVGRIAATPWRPRGSDAGSSASPAARLLPVDGTPASKAAVMEARPNVCGPTSWRSGPASDTTARSAQLHADRAVRAPDGQRSPYGARTERAESARSDRDDRTARPGVFVETIVVRAGSANALAGALAARGGSSRSYGTTVSLHVRPFEVVALRVVLAS